jgi:hypothetical protein
MLHLKYSFKGAFQELRKMKSMQPKPTGVAPVLPTAYSVQLLEKKMSY